MSSFDQPIVLYQGPPRWTGSSWENGERFTLSGVGKADMGVELAGSVSGLDRPDVEYRYDAGANTPGSRLVSSVAGRRNLLATINILGTSEDDLRRNKQRWERAHSEQPGNPGRLWVMSNSSHPRYLEVHKAETAGTSTLDKDPHIRYLYEGWDWGWTSDSPYFKGYTHERTLDSSGTRRWTDTFYNESTAPHIYPKLYLYGPGRFVIDGGYTVGELTLPSISSGEVIRVDYNPKNKTVLKRTAGGTVINIWPTLGGQRPMMTLEPETHNTVAVRSTSGTPNRAPVLEFTPEFVSWI